MRRPLTERTPTATIVCRSPHLCESYIRGVKNSNWFGMSLSVNYEVGRSTSPISRALRRLSDWMTSIAAS